MIIYFEFIWTVDQENYTYTYNYHDHDSTVSA